MTDADERPPAGLSPDEAAVLAYEARTWPGPGAKERAIREGLGMPPVRYYQLLNALMDDPRALRHAPGTVNRLRRIREAQRARR
ncbi:DUF3263 domain-containing protein [Streptomyces sp. NPDC002886]|uniref:DUF3263 domain-containing protein n=1 Tax=unclassified Streptomyces TaxID=2593676 RepID=UPI0020B66A21|nr:MULTISPECIES: DUF3263 domain-containing protein [unclassified Streptomyces]MCP3759504.1 DUF3263 domain-containing protein [Streptomyces sp. TBY4]WSK21984.1 DUF3263 domain-containing protein [Streptomyces sp. NBC_01298]